MEGPNEAMAVEQYAEEMAGCLKLFTAVIIGIALILGAMSVAAIYAMMRGFS